MKMIANTLSGLVDSGIVSMIMLHRISGLIYGSVFRINGKYFVSSATTFVDSEQAHKDNASKILSKRIANFSCYKPPCQTKTK